MDGYAHNAINGNLTILLISKLELENLAQRCRDNRVDFPCINRFIEFQLQNRRVSFFAIPILGRVVGNGQYPVCLET